jgi:hypothetical protein
MRLCFITLKAHESKPIQNNTIQYIPSEAISKWHGTSFPAALLAPPLVAVASLNQPAAIYNDVAP